MPEPLDTTHLFTSESVTEGHPDKMADQISDAILDAVLTQDPMARVACETFVTTGMVVVGGEISTSAYVDVAGIVRATINEIGYSEKAAAGFDGDHCAVLVAIDEQSPDIAQGVNEGLELRSGDTGGQDEASLLGAGDQGMMFGFACRETPQLMPLPITLAHALTRRLATVRKEGTLPWLRPDGKAQVTVRYVDGKPVAVDTVVVSTQHAREFNGVELTVADHIQPEIIGLVIEPVLGAWMNDDVRVLVNPTGTFVLGGPVADAGLTGRKIIVDTYGGYARHGGGAFSGKDATKVDRSASYAARWVAKNVVAAGLAERCEVQVAYAIGVAKPVAVYVETFGTETVAVGAIRAAVEQTFDLRPAAIIQSLDLRRPIFRQTAAYGHFGRTDVELPWERTDRVDQLHQAVTELTGTDIAASLASGGSLDLAVEPSFA